MMLFQNCILTSYIKMPTTVFGNSSKISEKNSMFVQKPYLKSKFSESNIEEDIDMKNPYRIKNLANPISMGKPANKLYVDNQFNDPSIKKHCSC